MDTQQNLDKWIASCLNYYNLKTNNKMKTTEERVQQLELAHARLFNQVKDVLQDLQIIKDRMGNNYLDLDNKISDLKKVLSTEEEQVLPENLVNGKEYKGVLTEIIKCTPTKWKNMQYTNWEVRLEGKDQYVMVAFVPSEYILAAGDKVRFTYGHPFQLRKLKQI